MRDPVNTVVLLGAGLIGSGWAARCLAYGLDVVAWDPDPSAEATLVANVDNAWPILEEVGLRSGADRNRLKFETSLEAALSVADYVQENAPDDESLKIRLITQADQHLPPDVVIASSSSGIRPTLLQEKTQYPQRVMIGHPFNPVYLLPLVEIVGGQATDEDTLRAGGAFYRSLSMRPLLAPVEIDGYISDRLQQVLFHEALYMIEAGICTPAQIDAAITGGPGLRWAFLGPMLTFHLAGGEGGIRHSMAHWAPEVANRWTHLPAPDFTEKLVNATAVGCEEIQAGRSIKEFERRRDRCLVEIQRALDEFWFPPNEDGWPEMPQ